MLLRHALRLNMQFQTVRKLKCVGIEVLKNGFKSIFCNDYFIPNSYNYFDQIVGLYGNKECKDQKKMRICIL